MNKLAAVISVTKPAPVVLTNPPKTCQLCGDSIKGEVVDGRTLLGAWAYMCPKCHSYVGRGLGTGKGQLYRLTGGKYQKIAG